MTLLDSESVCDCTAYLVMCSLSLDEFNAAINNRNCTETSLLNDYCSFEFCLPQPMEAKAQCYLIYLCLAKLDQRKFLN